jgi:hypothetical protein
MKHSIANIIFLFLCIAVNAQQSKSELHKTVDSINAILKANQLAYYTDNNQNSAFIKKISVNEQGILSFTDSIPKPESTTTGKKTRVTNRLLSSKNNTNPRFVCGKKMGYPFSLCLSKRQK